MKIKLFFMDIQEANLESYNLTSSYAGDQEWVVKGTRRDIEKFLKCEYCTINGEVDHDMLKEYVDCIK